MINFRNSIKHEDIFRSMINKCLEIYGNRGWFFDALICTAFVGLMFLFSFDLTFLDRFLETGTSDALTFFGILLGFLLTAFSLLLTFNPSGNSRLEALRSSEEFRKVLHSFLSASALTLILGFILLLFGKELGVLFVANKLIKSVMVWPFGFLFLRLLRCLFSLYAVVEITY